MMYNEHKKSVSEDHGSQIDSLALSQRWLKDTLQGVYSTQNFFAWHHRQFEEKVLELDLFEILVEICPLHGKVLFNSMYECVGSCCFIRHAYMSSDSIMYWWNYQCMCYHFFYRCITVGQHHHGKGEHSNLKETTVMLLEVDLSTSSL